MSRFIEWSCQGFVLHSIECGDEQQTMRRKWSQPKFRHYQWRTEGGTPPKFRKPTKIEPNSTRLWKLLKIAKFRTPTPQDVRKKGSKILKLPPVRNCFTPAMINKLVVIINNHKVQKIKKILLYEMKFLVQHYRCLQNPRLGAYRPQIPVLSALCPQLNLMNPAEQNTSIRHCYQRFSERTDSFKQNCQYTSLELNPVPRKCDPGSSVGIATDYGLDGPGSNPGVDEIFLPSRPSLGLPSIL
jgi:hypothetical protein